MKQGRVLTRRERVRFKSSWYAIVSQQKDEESSERD